MKILTSQNPRQQASAALQQLIQRYKNVPVLFLSSGGSALSLLEPSLLPEGANITVSVLDEHYTPEAAQRNFVKLKRLDFSAAAKDAGAAFFDPYRGSAETAGKRFDSFLQEWLASNPQGKVVCTVGIGTDGHTAGIVPFANDAERFAQLFLEPNTLAVGYATAYGPFPQRVTSTFELLKRCSDGILYVAGAEKKEMLIRLLSTERSFHEFPAMFLKTLPQVTLFTQHLAGNA